MSHYHRVINVKKGRVEFLLLVILLVVMPCFVSAQEYPIQYLEQALENNPGLRVQYLDYEASLQQADIAAGLPSPELTAGIYTPPMERLMGSQLFDAGLMQMFPWFGTLSAERSAAEQMAGASYEQYRNQRNNLFLQITNQWLDIYQIREQMDILLQYTDVLKAREDLVYSRYEGGVQNGSLALDIYRLQMQLNELENRYEKLNEVYTAKVRNFNILLDRDQDVEVEIPDTLFAPELDVYSELPDSSAFLSNPVVARAQAQANVARFQQELSVLRTRPMLGVGLQYSQFGPGEAAMGQMDGGSMIMPMLSVTLPIYMKKNEAIRQQGEIRAHMARVRQDERINEVSAQWVQIASEMNNLFRDRRFLENQLEINQMAWELVITSYSGGQEDFEELLRIEDQLLDLEWRLLETIVKQNQVAARLDMLLAREVFE